jgi:hypothetical protein
MIPVRTATNSSKLTKAPYMLGLTLLALAFGSSIAMAEDTGTRDATFAGATNNARITQNGPATKEVVIPFLPTMDPATYAALKSQAAAAPRGVKPSKGLAPFHQGAQPEH